MIRKAKINDDGTLGSEEVPFQEPRASAGTLTWQVEVDESGNIVNAKTKLDIPLSANNEIFAEQEELAEREALIEAGIIGFDQGQYTDEQIKEWFGPYDWGTRGDFAS